MSDILELKRRIMFILDDYPKFSSNDVGDVFDQIIEELYDNDERL